MNKKSIIISDEELLKQFCEGNTLAFENLYSRYYAKLLYFITQMLGNTENAKDILQEVFIKIVENKCKFDFNRKFSVWIYSIASNMCKNKFKHNAVVKKAANEILYTTSKIEEVNTTINEKKIAIRNAIKKLDIKHKQVFILRHSYSFSFKEIANILEISEGTVKSRMFNCIKKISEQKEIQEVK